MSEHGRSATIVSEPMEILSPAAPASETPKDHDNLERAPTAVAAGGLSPRSSAAMGEVAASNNWEAEFDRRFRGGSIVEVEHVKDFIRQYVFPGMGFESPSKGAKP